MPGVCPPRSQAVGRRQIASTLPSKRYTRWKSSMTKPRRTAENHLAAGRRRARPHRRFLTSMINRGFSILVSVFRAFAKRDTDGHIEGHTPPKCLNLARVASPCYSATSPGDFWRIHREVTKQRTLGCTPPARVAEWQTRPV